MNEIAEEVENDFNSDCIGGFDTDSEKKTFFEGAKYGIEQALYRVSSYADGWEFFSAIEEKWLKFREKWKDKQINQGELINKKCKHCDGIGWIDKEST